MTTTASPSRAETALPPPYPLALRSRPTSKLLGISERTLFSLTESGEIPCVRVGSGPRQLKLYPVAMLEKWLEDRATPRAD